MNDVPFYHRFDDPHVTALTVVALRNEAAALGALQRHDDAAVLSREADRIERHALRVRPLVITGGHA